MLSGRQHNPLQPPVEKLCSQNPIPRCRLPAPQSIAPAPKASAEEEGTTFTLHHCSIQIGVGAGKGTLPPKSIKL